MGLLNRLGAAFRSSPENPSTNLSTYEPYWAGVFGAEATAAGTTIDHSNALNLTPVWACVRVISEDVGSLPLNVYKRDGASKGKAPEHPVHRLLHDRPNPETTAFSCREALQAHVLTWGNGYAEIERLKSGRPVALWPITPDRVTVGKNISGGKVYVIKNGSNRDVVIQSQDMLHIPGLGFDGIRGYSVITMEREAIGLAKATEEHGSRFFGNGSRPGGVLTRPLGQQALSQEAKKRLKGSWESAHQGLSNAQRVAILEEGMDWKQIGISPEDSQFLETRKFQVREICRMFRVPPHIIQDLDNATFSNIEQQSLEYVTRTLRPWLVRFEQQYNWSLFTEAERQTYFTEHVTEGLLRGDQAARSAFYNTMFQLGVFSPNEIRELENKNPVEGGDQRFVQLNLVPLDKAGDVAAASLAAAKKSPADTTPAPGNNTTNATPVDTKPARQALYADVVSRMVTRELIQGRKALKKGAESFGGWVISFYDQHEEDVSRGYLPAVSAMNAIENRSESAESEAKRLASDHCRAHRKALEGALEQIDPTAAVSGVFDAWESRFTTIQEKAA